MVPRVRQRQKVETEGGQQLGRWETENCCLIGIEFQFGRIKKLLKMDGDDGCTTMGKYFCN